jgi:hypothetical protein
MKRIGLLIVAVAMLWTARAEALCFSDNISSGANNYNLDWTSPDGTGHWSGGSAMYIQLHQTCGWQPWGTLSGTMRWFDTGQILSINGPHSPTSWTWNNADFRVFEPQQSNWFWFSCAYQRPRLWICAMKRYDVPTSSWVNNGTMTLW